MTKAPKRERVLDLIGLAARAGSAVAGTERVRQEARAGGLRFAVIATDASENAQQKLIPLLRARQLPFSVAFRRHELGLALGRSGLSAVAITRDSFAMRLAELLDASSEVD